jgi:hypothetical protein
MMGLDALISSVFFDAMYDDIVLSRSACMRPVYSVNAQTVLENQQPPRAGATSSVMVSFQQTTPCA